MHPFEMFLDKFNPVIILNDAVFIAEAFLAFNSHAVLGNKTFDISVMFSEIGENVIDSFS